MATNGKPNPIPATYRRVTPCLVVGDAAGALEFYAAVFGARVRLRFPGPGGTVAHAEMEIGDAVVIVEDASPMMGTEPPPADGLPGTPVFQYVYVEDVDSVVARAAQLGATVRREPQDQFYGSRDAFVVDPYGHAWTIASRVEDVGTEEATRRMRAMVAGHAGEDQ
jgi:PhnB protein